MDQSKLEQAAKEFAEGLMGIGEYSEKWHSGDKSLFHAIVRGVRHGANWQSLTTPASNEVEVLINEFYELYRKFEKDPDEDEHPYNRGVRVGKSITYANVVNRMREFLNSIATPASNEVEKGAWVSAKDSWPNERGSFITQNDSGGIGDYFIDDVNETSKKLWFNCAEAWLSKWWDKNASKPHTIERPK